MSEGSTYCWHCGEELEDDLVERLSEPSPEESESTEEPEETSLAAITHLLGLFTWILGPLVVLLATDDEFVRQNAANALNWQISYFVYVLISVVLIFVLIGFFTLLLVVLLDLVFCLVATVKAAEGEAWDYPFAIQIA